MTIRRYDASVMTQKIDRSDIESALWVLSGCAADQRSLQSVMQMLDQYARQAQPTVPAPRTHDAKPDVDKILAEARAEAQRIVQEAQEQAPAALVPVDMASVSMQGYRDADGALWLRLGVFPDLAGEALDTPRTCRDCGEVKTLADFRTNGKKTASRRRQCTDCENKARRRKDAEKRASNKG